MGDILNYCFPRSKYTCLLKQKRNHLSNNNQRNILNNNFRNNKNFINNNNYIQRQNTNQILLNKNH